MNKQTKIIVLQQKKLICALILILIIIAFCLAMLIPKNKSIAPPTEQPLLTPQYTAGVYSSTVVLNGNPVELKVTMDKNYIHQISAINISETMETSYPLFNSCLQDITTQVIANNSTENVTYASDNKYTSMVLIGAIESAIQKSIAQSN